jgi:predicted transcriptional regulator of viral defense system
MLMTVKIKQKNVLKFIRAHAVVRPKDLVALGLPRAALYQLEQDKMVRRIGRGLYQLTEQKNISQWQSLLEVQKLVPKGVICLQSALVFHEIGTQNPHDVWLALEEKAWQPKIEYPVMRFIRMSGLAFTEGIEIHKINGVELKVFSVAKTVVDCFKFRNKVGLDVAMEALKEGWRSKKFTIDELNHFAEICRVHKVIRPYVEAIIAH